MDCPRDNTEMTELTEGEDRLLFRCGDCGGLWLDVADLNRILLHNGLPTLEAIVSLHVGLLASYPDTLIARKAGLEAAQAVSAAAREVRDGTLSLGEFDASLRGAGNRLNPGTTADLVAGTLLAALLSGLKLP